MGIRGRFRVLPLIQRVNFRVGSHTMNLRRRAVLALVLASVTAWPVLASSFTAAAFKKLQSLAGDWEGKDEHGMAVRTNFKVVAGKTAVIETIAPSGMEEMVSLYSVDQDSIALAHFCPTDNQPRMRATLASQEIKELDFTFEGAGNLKSPSAGHQHHLVLHFEDADHITETWTWRAGDKDTPMFFHLTRKKN